MRLTYSEIADRLPVNSAPIFGISWSPPSEEVESAFCVIAYLENCPVLYEVDELKNFENAVNAVLEVRDFLSENRCKLNYKSQLASYLSAMKVACRKFAEQINIPRKMSTSLYFWLPEVNYYSAIGELRGIFGLHIAHIAVRYGIDVHGPLTEILPFPPHQFEDVETFYIHFMKKPIFSELPNGIHTAKSRCACGWSLSGSGKSKNRALDALWKFFEFHIVDENQARSSPYRRNK